MRTRFGPQMTWEVVASGRDGPGPRSRHVLTHDLATGATVLFSGIVWHGNGGMRDDTWELREGRWRKIEVKYRPAARHRGAMVYDPVRGYSVLFGGQSSTLRMLGDTWIYRRGEWIRRRAWMWRRPSPRCGHAMAFDEANGTVVLFGGIGRLGQALGDTWTFDGNDWRKVAGPSPPARRYAAFAYDPSRKGCILHGGAVDDRGYQTFGDTWLYQDGQWTSLPESFDTGERDDHGIAYHKQAKRLVMLDGVGGSGEVLEMSPFGWRPIPTHPPTIRHQCSPLVWDDTLGGILMHGGETHHGGAQYDETFLLRFATI